LSGAMSFCQRRRQVCALFERPSQSADSPWTARRRLRRPALGNGSVASRRLRTFPRPSRAPLRPAATCTTVSAGRRHVDQGFLAERELRDRRELLPVRVVERLRTRPR
jgi:hypothetical protein